MSISFVKPALKPPQTVASMAATDGELLMRFHRYDDETAFAEVVERHGRLVWLVCQQVLRNRADVEDAFQATFLVLAQKANTIRASESAAAWLYKVAYRTAIAARRRRSSRREESLASEPPQGEAALPLLGDRHMHSVLMEELRGLPSSYQAVLVMRYLEGQSRRSIAAKPIRQLAKCKDAWHAADACSVREWFAAVFRYHSRWLVLVEPRYRHRRQ